MGGKTGTTQQHSDGWFMAVTPGLVGGVWVGAEDRSIHFQNITNGQGASMALPIWAKFLGKVIKDPKLKFDTLPFEKPAGVSKNLDCQDDADDQATEVESDYQEDNEEFY